MLYLDEDDLSSFPVGWDVNVSVVERVVALLAAGDFAQPVKPYLRYGPAENRIIAMPAFVGGDVHTAGLKWIASFPGNRARSLPRAHSVVVLNDADTGVPTCIVNGPLLSVLRTASISGLVLRRWIAAQGGRPVRVGVTGWGPIGRRHVAMMTSILGAQIADVRVYDPVRPSETSLAEQGGGTPMRAVSSWQEAYDDADVFVTCTVARERYVDRAPKPQSLHLNVSLRDYRPDAFEFFDGGILVDDWEEVCREDTDIEVFHRSKGLTRAGVISLAEAWTSGAFGGNRADGVVMFNPMGMAVFDVAFGAHFSHWRSLPVSERASDPENVTPRLLVNPRRAHEAGPAFDAAPIRAFHGLLPGYRPTPLRSLPALAAELDVGAVLVKDETERFGLPSFKVLGASWAAARALVAPELPSTPEAVAERAREQGRPT